MIRLKDGDYLIRVCLESEIDQVMSFIRDYWRKDHILSYHKELLKWQYYNKERKHFNFILAQDKTTKGVLGILGYIPTSKYAPELVYEKSIWLALWKVRKDIKISGLGLFLLSFLMDYEKPASVGVVGFNPQASKLYSLLGYKTGFLNQFYMVNSQKFSFNLIEGFNNDCYSSKKAKINLNKSFLQIRKANFTKLKDYFSYRQPDSEIPKKSLHYFYNRYINHPIYHYELYAVLEKREYIGLMVIRRSEHKNNCALRIVDYFGSDDGMTGMKNQFQKLLKAYDAEYIDILNYGTDDIFFEESGFLKLNPLSKIIIPNHYEPFEKRNIRVAFAFQVDQRFDYKIFKGDGDQDRPNLARRN